MSIKAIISSNVPTRVSTYNAANQVLQYDVSTGAPSRGGYSLNGWLTVLDNKSLTADALSGYSFDGWYTTADNVSVAADAEVADATTLICSDRTIPYATVTGSAKRYSSDFYIVYPKYTASSYSVTLQTDGGTVNSGNVTGYTYGTGATLPTNVTRTGYEFGGWFASSDLTGEAVARIATTDSGNKTFYAKWTPASYYVTLQTNGGSVNSGNVSGYTYGTGVTLPTDVTKQGSLFGGWFDNSDLTGTQVLSIPGTATGNKTFYAKWNPYFTVTFKDHDGNVLKNEQVQTGGNATPPAPPTLVGYTFSEWSGIYESVSADTTVTATYTQNTYTVRFLDVDGTSLHTETVTHGGSATPPDDPTRSGMEFTGWNGSYSNITGNTDVYATYSGAFNYVCRGRRWQRLYAAASLTPCYAAKSDAATIAKSLCTVPWTETESDYTACLPAHAGTDETDTQNVALRQHFDAAMFCAGHANGMHRAYAQATCYRLALPSSAVNKKLTTLSVDVSGDPYLKHGARISVMTNSTGVIPTDCQTCRTGSAYASGVAARTTSQDGSKWYAASESVTLTPQGGLVLGSFLYVFVLLENYSYSRSEYLEGSAYISPDIRIGMESTVSDWSTTGTNVCRASLDRTYNVCRGGILPKVSSEGSSAISVSVLATGDATTATAGSVTDEQGCIGLRTAYAAFYRGIAEAIAVQPGIDRIGAAFSIRKVAASGSSCWSWRITAAALAVPFAAPVSFNAEKIRLDWSSYSGTATAGSRFNVWLRRGNFDDYVADAFLKAPAFWDAKSTVGDLQLLGSIDATAASKTATLDLVSPLLDRVATVYLSAFVSMDDFNPGSGMTLQQGTSTEFDVESLTTGWKPDITLIG